MFMIVRKNTLHSPLMGWKVTGWQLLAKYQTSPSENHWNHQILWKPQYQPQNFKKYDQTQFQLFSMPPIENSSGPHKIKILDSELYSLKSQGDFLTWLDLMERTYTGNNSGVVPYFGQLNACFNSSLILFTNLVIALRRFWYVIVKGRLLLNAFFLNSFQMCIFLYHL